MPYFSIAFHKRQTFIAGILENEEFEMCYFEYLLFSVLYDQMTSNPFETIMINMWFENQQKCNRLLLFS